MRRKVLNCQGVEGASLVNFLLTLRRWPGYFSSSAVCYVAAKEVISHGKTKSQRGG